MTITDLPMPERIREMRRLRGMNGYRLAEAVGVSPSYISLIEKGMKIPQEDVAVRIARVLGDDEEAFRIWAASSRMSPDARETIWSQLPLQAQRRYQSGGRAWRALERAAPDARERKEAVDEGRTPGDAAALPPARQTAFSKRRQRWEQAGEELEASANRVTEELRLEAPEAEHGERHLAQQLLMTARDLLSRVRPASSSSSVLLPVLPEGEPLADGPLPNDRASGHFPVRPDVAKRLGDHAVALEVTADNGARVAATLRPGDIVVLDRRWSELRPDAIFAVRLRGALVLSRCTHKGGSLVLLGEAGPGGASVDVEILPAPDEASLRRLIAGRVALSVRAWI